jgi:polysaccharide export outer membrane protein
MNNKPLLSLILISSIFFTGCKILQPSKMLKTDKEYVFDSPGDSISIQYKIAPDDLVRFQLYSNDGFKMLENIDAGQEISANSMMSGQRGSLSYPVEFDGVINLPILGRIHVEGKTARECEFYLEKLYAEYYINPFVTLTVSNRKVLIFPGEPGAAQVLKLGQGPTTLLEALAMTGGIRSEGKAYNIKLIRGDAKSPQVFEFDLSKMENLYQANMVLESDDIIYIDQRIRPVREILAEIQPIIGLSATLISLITAYLTWRSITSLP